MRKGESQLDKLAADVRKRRDAIRENIHPMFFEIAMAWKESIRGLRALGPHPPQELANEITQLFEQKLKEIRKHYPDQIEAYADPCFFSVGESDGAKLLEWLHFHRHRTVLWVDIEKMDNKDYNAAQRVLRTANDWEMLRCGKEPLKPFKGELEHFQLFEIGLPFGLDKLSPEQLADVFDEFCPCDKEHDPSALRKLRSRVKKIIVEASEAAPVHAL